MATTTTKCEETLVDWLRDAHAMEKQAEQMLSNTAKRIEHYPELKSKIETHLDQTRRQAELVKGCLERHGESTSTLKDTAGSIAGLGQALSGLFVSDEIAKASMASFTFEEMEIAAYKMLIAAAEECGDADTKRVCETILREEQEMAQWLDRNLPAITQQFLRRAESGMPAHR